MGPDRIAKADGSDGEFRVELCSDGRKDVRCACGSLLARLLPEGVELKCRRCRRVVVVPLT